MKSELNSIMIEVAQIEDLVQILELQKLCYQKEAKRYNDFKIPPLTQTIDEIRSEYPKTLFLKAVHTSKLIGSIKGSTEGDTCHVGRLMVHPSYQRQGIGKRLIQALESEIQKDINIGRFELFTGELSHDNISLYESQGYRIFKTEPFDSEKNIVYMEKMLRKNKI